MRLFPRQWRVRVDDFAVTDLSVSFQIEKSTKREPNKCSLKIRNLNATHRRQLDALSASRRRDRSRIRVEIEAGYPDAMALLFSGDLRTAKTTREDLSTFVTEIEGEDGGRAIMTARVNQSFPPGTSIETVVRACARAMGVGAGNANELASAAAFDNGGRSFANGTVLSGSAATELEHVLRSVGLRYSVQNGVLQLQRRGQPLQGSAVLLSRRTGLVGTPEPNADGTLTATSLLIPDLTPGRVVVFDGVESVDVGGSWRIERVKYTGDSSGQDWYAALELRPR